MPMDPEAVRRQAELDALEGLRRLKKKLQDQGNIPKEPLPKAPNELGPPTPFGWERSDETSPMYRTARATQIKRRRAALRMA